MEEKQEMERLDAWINNWNRQESMRLAMHRINELEAQLRDARKDHMDLLALELEEMQ